MLNTPTTLLARFRQTALKQASEVLLDPAAADDPKYKSEAFPRVAALLASSLEELRVIEEELDDQSAALAERQQEANQRIEYERRLFDLAPAALLVTDMAGAITDANRAACTLLGQDTWQLERKPVVTFIGETDRSAFRTELSRIGVTQGVADWRFRVTRRRDVPVFVSAAVHVVERANRHCGRPGLFWCLRPLAESDAPHVVRAGAPAADRDRDRGASATV